MKKLVIISICIIFSLQMYAQSESILNEYNKKLPDWVLGTLPKNYSTNTYYYKSEGVDRDRDKARQKAILKAFQQSQITIAIGTDAASVYKAIENGESLEVISQTFKIPIHITCEHVDKNLKDGKFHYWILFQIAKNGNTIPDFNYNANCDSYEKWDALVKNRDDRNRKLLKSLNGNALAASFFISGAGQMYKGKGTAGTFILLSELALIGGGTTCYFYGKKQLDIMRDINIEYNAFNQAKNTYNTMRIVSYSCYGAAAALYIFNLCHAYMVTPSRKKYPQFSYNAKLIPDNDFLFPSYAMGVGMNINF